MPSTDAQDRIVNALIADPYIWRLQCEPQPDGSIEVWCYGSEDVLQSVRTVLTTGQMVVRPGWRVTNDKRVGNPDD